MLPGYSQDFTGASLSPQWSWIRENSADWSLTIEPGTLTIDAVNGDLYQTNNTAQNLLVEKAPPGDFVAEAKLALRPDQTYERAGLLLYQDDNHYFRLVGVSNSGIDETEWAKETDVTSSYTGFSCGSGYPVDTCPVYGNSFLEVLITVERHLRLVLDDCVGHYNSHRPDRTLRQDPPAGRARPPC